MPGKRTPSPSLWTELKRRRVFRVAGAYALTAWLVIEIATTTFPLLRLPEWSPTLVLWLALAGFPIALVLAWVLDVTPDGIRRTSAAGDVPDTAAGAPLLRRGAWIAAAGMVGMLALASFWYRARAAGDGGERIASIAVLPFLDLSAEGDQEYFSAGIADELLDVLAKVPGLQVTARTSSFRFRDQDVDVRDVGRLLQVEAVLEGSVRRSADRVRITAQLVKTSDGYHLWSETYDRRLDDVIQVQDEISRAIVSSIRPRLAGDSMSRGRRSENMAAYDAYLLAAHRMAAAYSETQVRQVLEQMERAVALDPDFALAHAGMGEAYLRLAMVQPPADALARGEVHVQRALALEPGLAEGLVNLATLRAYAFRWDEAAELFRTSISRNPTLAAACKCYGWVLLVTGDVEAARREIERARTLDPISSNSYAWTSLAAYTAGRRAEAGAEAAKGIALNPGDIYPRLMAAWVSRDEGRYDDSVGQLTQGVPLESLDLRAMHPWAASELGVTLARAGRTAEARALLRRMEAHAKKDYLPPMWLAGVHAALGNQQEALALLRAAAAERSVDLGFFVLSPMSSPLHGLAGYGDFLRSIGLGHRPEAAAR